MGKQKGSTYNSEHLLKLAETHNLRVQKYKRQIKELEQKNIHLIEELKEAEKREEYERNMRLEIEDEYKKVKENLKIEMDLNGKNIDSEMICHNFQIPQYELIIEANEG